VLASKLRLLHLLCQIILRISSGSYFSHTAENMDSMDQKITLAVKSRKWYYVFKLNTIKALTRRSTFFPKQREGAVGASAR
jgi:hypothetical protein